MLPDFNEFPKTISNCYLPATQDQYNEYIGETYARMVDHEEQMDGQTSWLTTNLRDGSLEDGTICMQDYYDKGVDRNNWELGTDPMITSGWVSIPVTRASLTWPKGE